MNDNCDGGIGLPVLLTIVFLVLKLCKVINWSWWWIFSPLWISVIIIVVMTIIIYLLNK